MDQHNAGAGISTIEIRLILQLTINAFTQIRILLILLIQLIVINEMWSNKAWNAIFLHEEVSTVLSPLRVQRATEPNY